MLFRYSANSPYDALVERQQWTYYKLNGRIDNGCNRVKRPAFSPFEGNIFITFAFKNDLNYFLDIYVLRILGPTLIKMDYYSIYFYISRIKE